MKGDTMLFTGSVSHKEDTRLELAKEDGSNLLIRDLIEDDSGQYECRIMVEKVVRVRHTLIVANIFSIYTDPAEAMVSVPLRGQTRFGCKTSGDGAEIQWTRDGGKFSSTGSYNHEGGEVELANVTIEDAPSEPLLLKLRLFLYLWLVLRFLGFVATNAWNPRV